MWKENWKQFIEDLKGIPSVVDSNEIAAPASSKKIAEIEKKFGMKLPPKFKDFLRKSTGGIDIGWSLEDGALVKLEGEREPISVGYFILSLDEILEMNFRIEEDYEPDEYDLEIHPRNLLAFASAANGDQFAVVHSGEKIDSIKYISLDLENIHLYTVGEDINSFLSHYARIGFAGCEYWIWEQFTNQRTTPIDSGSPKAVEFLDSIKGGIRSAEAEEENKRMKTAMRMAAFKVSVLPKAEDLQQKKDFEGFVKLLSEYEDLLSGELKEKYEHYVKKVPHAAKAERASVPDQKIDIISEMDKTYFPNQLKMRRGKVEKIPCTAPGILDHEILGRLKFNPLFDGWETKKKPIFILGIPGDETGIDKESFDLILDKVIHLEKYIKVCSEDLLNIANQYESLPKGLSVKKLFKKPALGFDDGYWDMSFMTRDKYEWLYITVKFEGETIVSMKIADSKKEYEMKKAGGKWGSATIID